MPDPDFEFDTDIVFEFVAESLEHLEGIDQQLMEYEQNPQDSGLINGIFRAIHSIKGSSGFLQLNNINKLSHQLENLLDRLRKGEKSVSPEIMDVLFRGCDMLSGLVKEVSCRLDQNMDLAAASDDEQLTVINDTLSRLLEQESMDQAAEEKDSLDTQQPAATHTTEYTITPQLLREFQVEANEHLEASDQLLVLLSENPDDKEALNALFRGVHSIKGTASYLGLTTIGELAHAAESMLAILRDSNKAGISDETLDLLFEALDQLKEMVAKPKAPSEKALSLTKKIEERNTLLKKNSGISTETTSVRPTTNLLANFLDAVEQHISALKMCVARSGEKEGRSDMVGVMFRAVHSLKSSAQYMGYKQVEEKAAIMEEALEAVRNGGFEPGPVIFDLIEDSVAGIENDLADIASTEQKDSAPAPPEAGSDKPNPEQAASPPPTNNQAPAKGARPQVSPPKTMRVNQTLLDTFMNLVGELIVARNAFGHIERRLEMGERERVEAVKELHGASQAVARISEELQRTVMEMRMVPIRIVFQKFHRMVRDLTVKSGKQAKIILQGEDTEIDKGIVEDLADPLVHIIRNCVDHGLESPDERKRAGKSESGTIILRASHEGNFIIIEIIDDGRGIDTDAVRARAIEKGLLDSEQADTLSHEEICGFIFKPGFSTAKKVTDISGRGVGMDVVMTNLKKLKGNVNVTSETGQGTKVRLEVPLTLALVDALLVQAAEQTFAMPLEAVTETVKVQSVSLKSLIGKKAITLRGEVVSIADLADLLGITRERKSERDELTVLILKLGATKLGLIVDRILRKEEIVVKPLADYLAVIPGLAGASILGNGQSILILEPAELMALASGELVEKSA